MRKQEPGVKSQEPGAAHGLAGVKILRATCARLSLAVAEKSGDGSQEERRVGIVDVSLAEPEPHLLTPDS